VSDQEIIDGIKLLARTEGVFAETAGGVTVAVTKKLIKSGKIGRDETTVICVTGNGLKTQEALNGQTISPYYIKPNIGSFEEVLVKIKNRCDSIRIGGK
jgi:threonine synthase